MAGVISDFLPLLFYHFGGVKAWIVLSGFVMFFSFLLFCLLYVGFLFL